MAHADVHPLRPVHQGEEPADVVVVIQGLPDPHEDNVGDGQAGILLGKDHLVQQFPRCEIPHPSPQGGGTEHAAHGAPHLGGNAHGVAVAVTHEHRLNAVAVGQSPEIFYGAVQL